MTIAFAMPGAVKSMADHLGFLLGYGASGLPGFPDPFNRHDRNKPNRLRVNARHIRNSLRSMKERMGVDDLRTFLQQELGAEEFQGMTEGLDNLAQLLTEQGWHYEQIGADLADEILTLLTEMNWIAP
jgi:hypothetical protein